MRDLKASKKLRRMSGFARFYMNLIGLSLVTVLYGLTPFAAPQQVAYAQSVSESVTQSGGQSSIDFLKNLMGGDEIQPQYLTVDEAYQVGLVALDSSKVQARFTIADGYYLYRDKTKFSSNSEGLTVGDLLLPEGELKTDAFFGEQQVYYQELVVEVPVSADEISLGAAVSVTVNYQGCAEQGICYPPMEKNISFFLPGISDANAMATDDGASERFDPDSVSGPELKQDFWWPIVLAFVAGIALTFTPCVLPLIPILTSIVAGQEGRSSNLKTALLSICYVLGTAVTYTAVGVFAGLTGSQLQAYFQNPWGIGVVVIILVGLSLSMFGLFQVQMPVSIQSALQSRLRRLKGGVVGGVFLMGIISALIVGACVSPVLMAVLGLAIERADPVLGGAIMFSLAIGSGVVLIAIGFGAAFLLPRAGVWTQSIKYAFGVMLLGVAIYILGALPAVPVLYLWALLLIVSAVYLGAFRLTPDAPGGWAMFWKGIGVFVLIWGVLALIGAMFGSRDILRPINFAGLAQYTQNGSAQPLPSGAEHSLFVRVSSAAELDAQLTKAKTAGKPVVLDYYADWCVDCVRMEKTTFSDPNVRQALGNFVMLQVDVTDPRNTQTNDLKMRYGVYGPPAMLFFDPEGNEIGGLRKYGYMNSREFIRHIGSI